MLTEKRAATSGWRDDTGFGLTPGHSLAISQHYGMLQRAEFANEAHILVGHDQRAGAVMLAYAALAGLESVGVRATYIGMVSTAVMSAYLVEKGMTGGVLITGSHMPPERIGIILLDETAAYCTADVTDPISDALPHYPAGIVPVWQSKTTTLIDVHGSRAAIKHYLEVLFAEIEEDPIRSAALKVLIDSGNGTAGDLAEMVFKGIGCEVAVIHKEPKTVPDRPSECNSENCQRAIQMMHDGDFDIGICLDGDGDRVKFITPNGVMLNDDVIAAIFARALLKPGDVCVSGLNSGGLIAHICREQGAKLVMCRIGQPSTGEAVKDHDPVFTFEETAGKFMFPRVFAWYDGLFVLAQMLELMAETGKSLIELAQGSPAFPIFHRRDISVPVSEQRKSGAIAAAQQRMRERFSSNTPTVDEQGDLRFDFADGAVVVARASGTEHKLRGYVSSSDEARADELGDFVQELFEEVSNP